MSITLCRLDSVVVEVEQQTITKKRIFEQHVMVLITTQPILEDFACLKTIIFRGDDPLCERQ